jgi:cytochrome-b5 reductase
MVDLYLRMVEMRGPILSFPYERNMVDEIGMIAGGTGITPMYQLIKQILRDTEDTTKISLIYANKDEILLQRELQILANGSPDRLKVFHVLENGGVEGFGKGYITKRMLRDHLPKGDGDKLVLVCGPDAMVKHVAGEKIASNNQGPVRGLLGQLSYSAQTVFKF